MSVNDNGAGMDETDARIACSRHATSKIRTIGDLDAIGTLGFRGEALASIAAVSKLTLRTRQPESAMGFELRIAGGEIKGWIVLDQIRAIDKARLRQRIGELSSEEISEVKNIIKEMLVE